MSKPNPKDRKYSKEHEWAKDNGDGTITMGITDHAQDLLTDIVFVELPAIGRTLKLGEAFAVVESVKTASDVYAPISGPVMEINEAVTKNPALVNDQPYGDGWFCKVKLTNPAELAALLSPADYSALIGG